MQQNANYDYAIQKLYLEIMLADATTFIRCQSIFDHTLFDRKLRTSAEFLTTFVEQYNALPTYDIINAATNSSFKRPENLREENYDWLLVEFETFIRHKGLERAIIESSDLLEKGEYGPVEEMIKKAVQVGLQKDMGTDYFANPKERLLTIKDNNGQISTGWKQLDSAIFGGFNRGELNVVCAPSGGGKSLFLANLGVNWSLVGLNVLYITLELSEALVSMRLDTMFTGIPSRDIFKQIDSVDTKVRIIGKKAGTIQVKYLPSGKTTNDIRSYMKEYEVKVGKKIDVLLVDYLDLLMPNGLKISAENLYIKDKFVSEQLRNMAMEKKCILVTASQLNRSSIDEVEYDHSHIAGGLSKIQTADNVIGIFTSKAMRDRGKYQIQLMKTRNSSGLGLKIDLEFNVDTLRISDTDDDTDDNDLASMSTGTSLLNNLKQKSIINDKKITPEVQSSELRTLLKNM